MTDITIHSYSDLKQIIDDIQDWEKHKEWIKENIYLVFTHYQNAVKQKWGYKTILKHKMQFGICYKYYVLKNSSLAYSYLMKSLLIMHVNPNNYYCESPDFMNNPFVGHVMDYKNMKKALFNNVIREKAIIPRLNLLTKLLEEIKTITKEDYYDRIASLIMYRHNDFDEKIIYIQITEDISITITLKNFDYSYEDKEI